MIPTTNSIAYTNARNGLASLLDRVSKNSEIVIINRRNKPDVALISKEELDSLLETVYLLRSPKNAKELFKAIDESKQMDDAVIEPQSVKDLCDDLNIVRDKTPKLSLDT
ncbi:prevent-host-death family protein [Pleurocapsa sp. CCALA 161]|uniref:type II toxin-antitoxin system Phd/YefM family antitoxin n=1 Tax=Pleurocapsa sp. CCALA 161 TaxID=2107688 RepID=UPI000D07CCD4|nr:type II toxin-antitoxin system prevent-host-death family antitoxin [Pleurocapsa sp. CCALA 161]PSB10338.1 prevent-host-death family protein [Pleurocapsa sp. CCALA 161]